MMIVQTNRYLVRVRKFTVGAVVGAIAALALTTTAMAQSPGPAVPSGGITIHTEEVVFSWVAPGEPDPLGVPYGEWAGRWWDWFIGTPADKNPSVVDNCAAGLTGDVLMLPTANLGKTFEINCNITEGQSVLASAGGTLCDDSGEPPQDGEDLVRCVDLARSDFLNPRITVDGYEVPDITRLWALSPKFSLDWPENNIFGIPPRTSNAVAGAWLAMIDLPVGAHRIVVSDEAFDAGSIQSAKLTANVQVAAK